MTNSSGNITFVLVSDLTVNGTFEVSSPTDVGTATWQINNGSGTQRTIILNDDLTIAANGLITVGTGNEGSTSQHNLTTYADITNNGNVEFFDGTDPELQTTYGDPSGQHTNELQGNAVTVTFSGTTDNTLTCNNNTDFYRLVLDKGTGQQAVLTVNSSSTANFRLFGPSDLGFTGSAPNQTSQDALSIINGTLELSGSIDIPFLTLATGNNYFPIPQNGALWLNGANVIVNLTDDNTAHANSLGHRIMLSGLMRVTDGIFDAQHGGGIGSQDGGAYLQEGGTVTTWQFRPRSAGSGVFSFNMTGGTLNVGYTYATNGGYTNNAWSRFDLSSVNSTFQMSGGTLNVAKPTDAALFQSKSLRRIFYYSNSSATNQ